MSTPLTVDIALTPTLVPPAHPSDGAVYVVIDVIRATTTLCALFERGARRVLIAPGIAESRSARERLGEGHLLAGEVGGARPPGFDLGNAPSELGRREPPRSRDHLRHHQWHPRPPCLPRGPRRLHGCLPQRRRRRPRSPHRLRRRGDYRVLAHSLSTSRLRSSIPQTRRPRSSSSALGAAVAPPSTTPSAPAISSRPCWRPPAPRDAASAWAKARGSPTPPGPTWPTTATSARSWPPPTPVAPSSRLASAPTSPGAPPLTPPPSSPRSRAASP